MKLSPRGKVTTRRITAELFLRLLYRRYPIQVVYSVGRFTDIQHAGCGVSGGRSHESKSHVGYCPASRRFPHKVTYSACFLIVLAMN